jgi:sugar O-acyltransferase (sialic acid O-acetyltransferase NeuD family)
MNSPVIIVGASPKARLVLDFMSDEGRRHEIVGVVDQDPEKAGGSYFGVPILGPLDAILSMTHFGHVGFCIALSERRFTDRERLVKHLNQHGRRLTSLISKFSRIAGSATLGDGCIVFPQAIVTSYGVIGHSVTLYTHALIEHDCRIADNVDVSPRASIAGGCSIARHCFIGINATVLPGCSIGEGSIVGAGSVVTEDVQAGVVVAGNPARIIGPSASPL